MRPNDLPQDGDLLLCFALGARAGKYFPKQANVPPEFNEIPSGLTHVPDNHRAIEITPGLIPASMGGMFGAAAASPLIPIAALGGAAFGALKSRPGQAVNDIAKGTMTGLTGGLGGAAGAALGGAIGSQYQGDPVTGLLVGSGVGGLGGLIGGLHLGNRVLKTPADREQAVTKQSDFLSSAQDGLNQAGDWLNQNAIQPGVAAFNKHVTDPISNRARTNLGIPEGGFQGFMERNPWAIAPIIGGGIGAGVGLLGSGGKKRKDVLGSVLRGGLLGAGAGGLAWGARELFGGNQAQPPAQETQKTIPEAPKNVTPGADLRAEKPELNLLQRKKTVTDSWGNSGQTNAFVDGPLQAAKNQYATLRMGGNIDAASGKAYDDAYRAVTNAEANQDWEAAAQYAKKLQELNDFHSNLIGNNLKAPNVQDVVSGLGSGLVPGFGGIAGAAGQLGSAARPGPAPSNFSLFGRPITRGADGLTPSAPDAQPQSMVDFAKQLRPEVEANSQAVNEADPSAMGQVPWYRSAAGRRSLETAGLGGLLGRGSQLAANATGTRIGPDARYYNQLEKGVTSPAPTRGLLGQPLRLMDAATRIGPEQANQKALTQIASVLNSGATGKFVTPDEVGQALRDPNHALRPSVVGAIRGLGGRTGEGVLPVAAPDRFDLRPAADNPLFLKSLQERLVKPPSKAMAQQQIDDLREQLRGNIPMKPETMKLLTAPDGPFGRAAHNAKLLPPSGKFGPSLPIHGPTHATTPMELLKKNTLGRLKSPTALGMLAGGLTPSIQAYASGERTKNTLSELLSGSAPGAHDLGDPKVQQRLLEWFRQRQPSADEREAQLR